MNKITTQLKKFFSVLGGGEEQQVNGLENAEVYGKYKSLDAFIILWKKCLKKMSVTTDVDISFSKYFTFGSDMAYIRKVIGQPKLAMDNADLDISILMYAVSIKGHSVNFELHFHEKKLFCINHTYNYLSKQERADIIHSLEETYHVSSSDFKHLIVDHAGNGLLVEESDKLTINYLAPNKQVKHLVELYPFESRKAV